MSKIERVSTDVSYGFGAVADVLNLAITEGLVSFTTDSNQIYVDMEGKRFCYDSIIMVATERELMELTTFASGKLYFAEDTKCLYMNENNKWSKVFETTEGIIESLPAHLSLSFVDVLPTTGSEKNIYLIDNSDYAGVEKQVWLWNPTASKFFRVVPTRDEIVTIIDKEIQYLQEELQVQYETLKAALGGQEPEDPGIAEALAELLENYPLKSTVYTKDETDAKLAETQDAVNDTISNLQDSLKKDKYVAGEFADVSGEITLVDNISTYKVPSTAIISFNISNVTTYEKTAMAFDLIITGCNTVDPVINENIKWLENVAPTYGEYANVLMTFKSIDKGATWLGIYQGGWN